MNRSPTKFAFTEIQIGHGLTLWIDGNSKITASGGTFDSPAPNAFSLPAISTCPGSTPACRASCYVGESLRKLSPETYEKYFHNERVIHRVLVDRQVYGMAHECLATWISRNCNEFRIHVSGDFFSEAYAQFWLDVCLDAPDVNFWTYLRSFWAVDVLTEAPNLVVNLSADVDNLPAARLCHNMHPDTTRICWMANDTNPRHLPVLPNGSVVFADYPNRGRDLEKPTEHAFWKGLDARERRMVCVADFFGQSESYRCGICVRCLKKP
jgi:hypothetical protein